MRSRLVSACSAYSHTSTAGAASRASTVNPATASDGVSGCAPRIDHCAESGIMPASALKPRPQRRVDGRGPLQGRKMPALGHDHELGAPDTVSDLGGTLGRRELVAVADQHQRRAADVLQGRTRIDASDVRGLLPEVGGNTHFLTNAQDQAREVGILLAAVV